MKQSSHFYGILWRLRILVHNFQAFEVSVLGPHSFWGPEIFGGHVCDSGSML